MSAFRPNRASGLRKVATIARFLANASSSVASMRVPSSSGSLGSITRLPSSSGSLARLGSRAASFNLPEPAAQQVGLARTSVPITDAFTAVMLLDSPKRRVVIACAQALTTFAGTGTAASDKLREFGIFTKLVSVVSESEEAEVCSNCLFTLGAICCTPANYRAMREADGINAVLEMLAKTNDSDVLQASLWVLLRACHADELNSRDALKSGAVPALLELLRPTHPQEARLSALVTLGTLFESKLWQDALKDEGIQALATVLEKDDVTLQQKACWAFGRALYHHDENRVLLSKSGALKPLCALLNTANVELLVNVLVLLSNCSEVVECRHALRLLNVFQPLAVLLSSPNGLIRTHTLTTLANLVQESRTNKLACTQAGALGPAVEQLEADDVDLARAAVFLVSNLSSLPELAQELEKQDVVSIMVAMLDSNDITTVVRALTCLGNMCEYVPARDDVRKAGGVRKGIALLSHESPDVQEKAIWALGRACIDNDRNKHAVIALEGLTPLLHLLEQSPSLGVRQHASLVLSNIASEREAQESFAKLGGLQLATRSLLEDDDKLQMYAAVILGNLAVLKENKPAIRDMGSLAPLIRSLQSPNLQLAQRAAWALGACVFEDLDTARLFHEYGGVSVMVQLLRHHDRDLVYECARCLEYVTISSEASLQLVQQEADLFAISQFPTEDEDFADALISLLAALADMEVVQQHIARASHEQLKSIVQRMGMLPPMSRALANLSLLVARVSQLRESRIKLVEAGLLPLMRRLMMKDQVAVGISANCCSTLHFLAQEEGVAEGLRDLKLHERVSKYVGEPAYELREQAALAIASIAQMCPESLGEMLHAGAVIGTVGLLSLPRDDLRRAGCLALGYLAGTYENKLEIRMRGAQNLLLDMLSDPDPQVAEASLWCLWQCAFNKTEKFKAAASTPMLKLLASSPSEEIQKYCVYELSRVTEVKAKALELIQLDAMRVFVERLLDSPANDIRRFAALCVANCCEADPSLVALVRQHSIVAALCKEFRSKDRELASVALLTLRQLVDVSPDLFDSMMDADNDLVTALVRLLPIVDSDRLAGSLSSQLKSSATLLLASLCRVALETVVRALTRVDAFEAICMMLELPDEDVVSSALKLIRALLESTEPDSGLATDVATGLVLRAPLIEVFVHSLNPMVGSDDTRLHSAAMLGDMLRGPSENTSHATIMRQADCISALRARAVEAGFAEAAARMLNDPDDDDETRSQTRTLLCFSVGHIAQEAVGLQRLLQTGVIEFLIHMSTSLSAVVRQYATYAIGCFLLHPEMRDEARSLNLIGVLLELLHDSDPDVLVRVTWALAQLTTRDADSHRQIRKMDGIRKLVELLSIPNETLQENIGVILGNCAGNMKTKKALRETGALERIVELLLNGEDELRSTAAFVLSNALAHSDRNKLALLNAGAMPSVVRFLRSDNDDLRKNIMRVLSVAVQLPDVAYSLISLDAMGQIVRIARASRDEELIRFATLVVGFVAATDRAIRVLVGVGAVDMVVHFLKTIRSEEFARNGLWAIGRLCRTYEARQAALDSNYLMVCVGLLGHSSSFVRQAAAHTIAAMFDSRSSLINIVSANMLSSYRTTRRDMLDEETVGDGDDRETLTVVPSGPLDDASLLGESFELMPLPSSRYDSTQHQLKHSRVSFTQHSDLLARMTAEFVRHNGLTALVAIIGDYTHRRGSPTLQLPPNAEDLLRETLVAIEGVADMPAAKGEMVKIGGMKALLVLLNQTQHDPIAVHVVLALGKMAKDSLNNIRFVLRNDGFRYLQSLLASPDTDVVQFACQVFGLSANVHDVRAFIRKNGVMRSFVQLLAHENEGIRSNSVFAISRALMHVENKTELRRAGGLVELCTLLKQYLPEPPEADAVTLMVSSEPTAPSDATPVVAPALRLAARPVHTASIAMSIQVYCAASIGQCFESEDNCVELRRIGALRHLLQLVNASEFAEARQTAAWALIEYGVKAEDALNPAPLIDARARFTDMIARVSTSMLPATSATAVIAAAAAALSPAPAAAAKTAESEVLGMTPKQWSRQRATLLDLVNLATAPDEVLLYAVVLSWLLKRAQTVDPSTWPEEAHIAKALDDLARMHDAESTTFLLTLIAQLADNATLQDCLMQREHAIRAFIRSMTHTSAVVRQAASFAAGRLTAHARMADRLLDFGFLDAFRESLETQSVSDVSIIASNISKLGSSPQTMLKEMGVVPFIVQLLFAQDPMEKRAALYALAEMITSDVDLVAVLLRKEAIRHLLRFAQPVCADTPLVLRIFGMLSEYEEGCAMLAQEHVFGAVCQLASSEVPEVRARAAELGINLGSSEQSRTLIRKQGGIRALIGLLLGTNELAVAPAMMMIVPFLEEPSTEIELRKAQCMKLLVSFLASHDGAIVSASCDLLRNLVLGHREHLLAFSELGGAQRVLGLLTHKRDNVRQGALALLVAVLSRADARETFRKLNGHKHLVALLRRKTSTDSDVALLRSALDCIAMLSAPSGGATADEISSELMRWKVPEALALLVAHEHAGVVERTVQCIGAMWAHANGALQARLQELELFEQVVAHLQTSDATNVRASCVLSLARFAAAVAQTPALATPATHELLESVDLVQIARDCAMSMPGESLFKSLQALEQLALAPGAPTALLTRAIETVADLFNVDADYGDFEPECVSSALALLERAAADGVALAMIHERCVWKLLVLLRQFVVDGQQTNELTQRVLQLLWSLLEHSGTVLLDLGPELSLPTGAATGAAAAAAAQQTTLLVQLESLAAASFSMTAMAVAAGGEAREGAAAASASPSGAPNPSPASTARSAAADAAAAASPAAASVALLSASREPATGRSESSRAATVRSEPRRAEPPARPLSGMSRASSVSLASAQSSLSAAAAATLRNSELVARAANRNGVAALDEAMTRSAVAAVTPAAPRTLHRAPTLPALALDRPLARTSTAAPSLLASAAAAAAADAAAAEAVEPSSAPARTAELEGTHGDGTAELEGAHGDGSAEPASAHGDGSAEPASAHGDGSAEPEGALGDDATAAVGSPARSAASPVPPSASSAPTSGNVTPSLLAVPLRVGDVDGTQVSSRSTAAPQAPRTVSLQDAMVHWPIARLAFFSRDTVCSAEGDIAALVIETLLTLLRGTDDVASYALAMLAPLLAQERNTLYFVQLGGLASLLDVAPEVAARAEIVTQQASVHLAGSLARSVYNQPVAGVHRPPPNARTPARGQLTEAQRREQLERVRRMVCARTSALDCVASVLHHAPTCWDPVAIHADAVRMLLAALRPAPNVPEALALSDRALSTLIALYEAEQLVRAGAARKKTTPADVDGDIDLSRPLDRPHVFTLLVSDTPGCLDPIARLALGRSRRDFVGPASAVHVFRLLAEQDANAARIADLHLHCAAALNAALRKAAVVPDLGELVEYPFSQKLRIDAAAASAAAAAAAAAAPAESSGTARSRGSAPRVMAPSVARRVAASTNSPAAAAAVAAAAPAEEPSTLEAPVPPPVVDEFPQLRALVEDALLVLQLCTARRATACDWLAPHAPTLFAALQLCATPAAPLPTALGIAADLIVTALERSSVAPPAIAALATPVYMSNTIAMVARTSDARTFNAASLRAALRVVAASSRTPAFAALFRQHGCLASLLDVLRQAPVLCPPDASEITTLEAAAGTGQLSRAAASLVALALEAMGHAAVADPESRRELKRLGTMATVVPLLQASNEAVQQQAVYALGQL